MIKIFLIFCLKLTWKFYCQGRFQKLNLLTNCYIFVTELYIFWTNYFICQYSFVQGFHLVLSLFSCQSDQKQQKCKKNSRLNWMDSEIIVRQRN